MNVSLQELRDTDLPLLLAWAHIKEIWTYLPTSRAGENLTWESHFGWWRSREDRMDWMIRVNLDAYGPRPVGVVIANLRSSEIGLYLGEVTLWGKGIGKEALRLGTLRMFHMEHKVIVAVIHPDNLRSIKLFTGLGFRKVGKARGGQDEYRLDFRTSSRSEGTVSEYSERARRSLQPSLA